MQLHAVTWKNGVGAMNDVGMSGFGGGTGMSPAAIAFASAKPVAPVIAAMFKILETEPRCVSCAPFGNPVVPDV
jgi:hypothetical protein